MPLMFGNVILVLQSSACLTAVLLGQAKLLSEEVLSVDGALITSGMQLWRPITAASFFGGAGHCFYVSLIHTDARQNN